MSDHDTGAVREKRCAACAQPFDCCAGGCWFDVIPVLRKKYIRTRASAKLHSQFMLLAWADPQWKVVGPNRAFLIQGDDRVGAIADVVDRLADAKINVTPIDAITIGGRYGALCWVAPLAYIVFAFRQPITVACGTVV